MIILTNIVDWLLEPLIKAEMYWLREAAVNYGQFTVPQHAYMRLFKIFPSPVYLAAERLVKEGLVKQRWHFSPDEWQRVSILHMRQLTVYELTDEARALHRALEPVQKRVE